MKKKTIVLMCMAVAIAMTSCEKPIVEEEAEAAAKELVPTADANVVIRVTDFILTPNDDARQTRAVEDITAYSTRFNFVIYGAAGLIRAWVNRNCKEPAVQMAELADTLIRP